MVRSISVIVTLITIGLSQAFESTSPLLAWSNDELTSISLLSPHQPTHVFRAPVAVVPSQSQQQQPFSDSSAPTHDLCSLSTILLVSIPSLHASDLSLLPSLRRSETGIRASLAAASAKIQSLYLAEHSRTKAVRGLAKRFVNDCGAVVEDGVISRSENVVEQARRSIRFDRVEGLEELALTGHGVTSERRDVMARVDAVIAQHMATLSSSYLIILTALPSPDYNFAGHQVKRAFGESSSIKEELFGSTMAEKALARNGTNIFKPDPKSGVLHRYVFFTPPLIFTLLLFILVLIPVILISTSALSSIETFQGLESKMTGSVGIDPSKA